MLKSEDTGPMEDEPKSPDEIPRPPAEAIAQHFPGTAEREAVLSAWGEKVGEEGRKTFGRFLRDGFFEQYMSGERILDIGYKGYLEDVHPILPQATGVDLDYPGYDGSILPFADESQDAVFCSHTLEHIADYRTVIREWFRVLKVSGYLIVVVPHQFLYERRREPPSAWNIDHKRFYTAASLLREIEEAVAPCAFRVRMVEDNDVDYDYRLSLKEKASGSYEVICVIQKLAPPAWAEEIFEPPKPLPVKAFRAEPPALPEAGEPIRLITATPPGFDRIALLKLDHRGDFALARGAFEALRRDFGQAHLAIVCGSWNASDARALGIFDECIAFDYFPENASQNVRRFNSEEKGRAALQALLGERRYDLAIDLRMDPDTRHLLRAVNAAQKAGFGRREDFRYLDIALEIPQATVAGRAFQAFYGAAHYLATRGEHRGYVIEMERQSTPEQRLLLYGPYRPLPAGKYTLRFLVEPREETLRCVYDVCAEEGRCVVAMGDLEVPPGGTACAFNFELSDDAERVEFRLWLREDGMAPAFRFFGCSVRRQGDRSGVHQSEAMIALAAVVFARAVRPYRESLPESADAADRSVAFLE